MSGTYAHSRAKHSTLYHLLRNTTPLTLFVSDWSIPSPTPTSSSWLLPVSNKAERSADVAIGWNITQSQLDTVVTRKTNRNSSRNKRPLALVPVDIVFVLLTPVCRFFFNPNPRLTCARDGTPYTRTARLTFCQIRTGSPGDRSEATEWSKRV